MKIEINNEFVFKKLVI